MTTKTSEPLTFREILVKPAVGTGLTVLAGLLFLFLCMMLPLVGKAGVKTPYATENFIAFFSVLLATMVACGLAIKSKLDRSKIDGSPRPVFTMVIGSLSVLLFFALILGLLKI